jgi:hypothetical protein
VSLCAFSGTRTIGLMLRPHGETLGRTEVTLPIYEIRETRALGCVDTKEQMEISREKMIIVRIAHNDNWPPCNKCGVPSVVMNSDGIFCAECYLQTKEAAAQEAR